MGCSALSRKQQHLTDHTWPNDRNHVTLQIPELSSDGCCNLKDRSAECLSDQGTFIEGQD
jgi:hypothetical protein